MKDEIFNFLIIDNSESVIVREGVVYVKEYLRDCKKIETKHLS